MSFETLSSLLWRERQLLELLLFKLEEEQLLLVNGRNRWLAHATREVENVLDQVRDSELGRAVASDAVAADLGIAPGTSLAEVAAAAPAPWDSLLAEHRQAFVTLTMEIGALAAGNRELLAAGHRAAQETLMAVSETVQTYDARGAAARPAGASLLDQTL